jgi:hypothetical protein
VAQLYAYSVLYDNPIGQRILKICKRATAVFSKSGDTILYTGSETSNLKILGAILRIQNVLVTLVLV